MIESFQTERQMTANALSAELLYMEQELAKIKERGFNCMMLIRFLTESGVTDWEDWHGAHIAAATGECRFAERCPIHARTIAVHGKRPVQLSLF